MTKRAITVAYIGLGSNVGQREKNIRQALARLSALPFSHISAISPFFATSPVGPAQRDFVNAVARLETGRSPDELLYDLKAIEKLMGRKPARRWGPRLIDLDILFYGSHIVKKPHLQIPHPAIAARRFVLEPLAAIVPGLRHPVLHVTVRKLRDNARLTGTDQKVKMI